MITFVMTDPATKPNLMSLHSLQSPHRMLSMRVYRFESGALLYADSS